MLHSPKVLLIGLDGATWDVLMPLVRQGKVPNIARLMKEGVYGELESIEPMMSPVVWTSIATGKSPEKHGVTNFYSAQSCLKSLRVWEILAEFGKTVGIFEWLVTSPPKPLKEFIIPGWLATTCETFPPSLEFIKQLTFEGKKKGRADLLAYFDLTLKGLRNGLRVTTALEAFLHAFYLKLKRPSFYDMHHKTISMKLRMQGDIAAYLLKKYQPDFSAIIFYATDQVPHHYWKFMEPSKFRGISEKGIAKYGKVISETYQKSDEIVGYILKCVPDDTTILIISDHGMEAVTDVEYVFKTEELSKHLNFRYKDSLQFQIIKNSLHIGINASRGRERKTLQRQLIESLREIRLVERDANLFDVTLDKHENVVAVVKLKDLDFMNSSVYFPPNNRVKLSSLIETEHLLSAKHSPKGIVIMKGRNILKNKELQPSSILDIAPTLLALMGLPVETDMDGRVIKEAFEEEFFQKDPIKYLDSYPKYFGKDRIKRQAETERTFPKEDVDEIKKKLRGLGYLE